MFVTVLWCCRSAGGSFGKMEHAHEEQYFRKQVSTMPRPQPASQKRGIQYMPLFVLLTLHNYTRIIVFRTQTFLYQHVYTIYMHINLMTTEGPLVSG